jgi:flagellar biosynthesis anti-sigma factor FlgM
MKKAKKPGRRSGPPSTAKKRNPGTGPDPVPTHAAGRAELLGNEPLMEQVRKIVAETPEVRPEKIDSLQEAVAEGDYEVDARKVANRLISELLIKR